MAKFKGFILTEKFTIQNVPIKIISLSSPFFESIIFTIQNVPIKIYWFIDCYAYHLKFTIQNVPIKMI